MKNKTLKISVSLIIFISFFIIPVSAFDHSKLICMDCHPGRFSIGSEYESDECGSCHMYQTKESLEQSHNPNTCKACHGVRDSETYHTMHKNVDGSCTTCHGVTGQAKPDKVFTDCAGCHGGKLHEIHGARLDDICQTCHGKTPGKSPENSIAGFQGVNNVYAKVIDYNRYTLLELIKRMFGWN